MVIGLAGDSTTDPVRTQPAQWPNAPPPQRKKPATLTQRALLIWWPGTESNHRHADFQNRLQGVDAAPNPKKRNSFFAVALAPSEPRPNQPCRFCTMSLAAANMNILCPVQGRPNPSEPMPDMAIQPAEWRVPPGFDAHAASITCVCTGAPSLSDADPATCFIMRGDAWLYRMVVRGSAWWRAICNSATLCPAPKTR